MRYQGCKDAPRAAKTIITPACSRRGLPIWPVTTLFTLQLRDATRPSRMLQGGMGPHRIQHQIMAATVRARLTPVAGPTSLSNGMPLLPRKIWTTSAIGESLVTDTGLPAVLLSHPRPNPWIAEIPPNTATAGIAPAAMRASSADQQLRVDH